MLHSLWPPALRTVSETMSFPGHSMAAGRCCKPRRLTCRLWCLLTRGAVGLQRTSNFRRASGVKGLLWDAPWTLTTCMSGFAPWLCGLLLSPVSTMSFYLNGRKLGWSVDVDELSRQAGLYPCASLDSNNIANSFTWQLYQSDLQVTVHRTLISQDTITPPCCLWSAC